MMRMKASAPQRDVALFALGPGLVTVLCAALWRIYSWPVPLPAQAAIFDWRLLGPSLALGLLGVWLSSRVGCPSAPSLSDGRKWAQVVLWSAGIGVALGV